MKKLEIIADELFNKIRGRYPKITLGDSDSTIVNDPKTARFFEFEVAPDRKVNVTLDEESLTMLFNDKLFDESETTQRDGWFNFLKELRQFARKRMLTFDTRDITKSNLDKRDFAYLSQEKSGDKQMSESKMYGTSQTSYQNIGNARLVVKHSEPVGESGNRNSKIHAIYIESSNGEKFKYPFKHMNGARAAANHVSEGGNLYDDIGKHIVSLSEELSKLRKFKTYMNRSNVMAEGLGNYLDVVNTRIDTVKETVAKLQRSNYYKTFVENFAPNTTEEVPEDVQTDWIDQLTIKQFNEELKGVFPYIYKLVSEANAVKELGPEDFIGEEVKDKEDYQAKKKALQDIQMDPNTHKDEKLKKELMKKKAELDSEGKEKGYKESIDDFFEGLMGQFGDNVCEDCGKPSWTTLDEEKQKGVDGKVCWKGYKRMGTKKKGGKTVDNCVKIKDDITYEGGMKQAQIEVQDWFEKFNKYKGTNGDDLAQGWIRATLDTGIMADAYDEDELEKFNKMKGYEGLDADWQDGDHADFKSNKSGASPITAAMFSTINAIMDKYGIDEEDVDDMSKADDPSYGKPDMRDEGNVEEGINTELLGDLESGLEDAKAGNDMSDFIADEIGDYIRAGMGKMGEEAWQDSVEGQALAELDPTDSPEEQAKGFQKAINILKQNEGNAYAHKVRQAKMNGKKKGDKIDGPDGKEITLEKDKKTPLGEFILSYFDRETGQFPKGETAVLTMVEKDYGDEYVKPASKFIESVLQTYEAFGQSDAPLEQEKKDDEDDYDPTAKATKLAIQQANANKKIAKARNDALKTSREVKSQYQMSKESDDLQRIKDLAGL